MKKSVSVIGSGFASLSAATCLAKEGFDVTVFEKNEIAGGRARKMEAEGFTFDLGPSWYWMPDVFEKYFNQFGKRPDQYYSLQRLNPSYRIYFSKDDYLDIPAGVDPLCHLFEELEPGSSKHLIQFLKEGKFKYDIGINNLVYKPGLSIRELADFKVITGTLRLHVFQSMSRYIRKFFKDSRIIRLLEFPSLFLGATPAQTPALYSLMNYADMSLGTWYPKGGMYKVVEGMVRLAEETGVRFAYHSNVTRIEVKDGTATGLWVNDTLFPSDFVVAGADYHHVEQHLLPPSSRRYTEKYWNKRVMAPSSLLFYLGLNTKLKGLQHHTLFFDTDFTQHAEEIYVQPQWPSKPQFYLSCTSISDHTVAPPGHENLVILIPVAPGLTDSEETREKYFDLVMTRLEFMTGQSIRSSIIFKRSYAHNDFISDYNAFKGNAYGLANTLLQTAHLKPSIVNKNVAHLFYTGQLTVPGPGVPPSLISGQVVAKEVIRVARKTKHPIRDEIS